jgi:hypothetical protein
MASPDRHTSGYPQIVVCAWCHVILSPPLDETDVVAAEITHTICPECVTRYFNSPHAWAPVSQIRPQFDS